MKNILYFTADWCHPCAKTRPIVEELNRESPDIKFQIIDSDIEAALAKSFEVRSIPTFIVIKDGKEITRATGSQTKEQLQELMLNE